MAEWISRSALTGARIARAPKKPWANPLLWVPALIITAVLLLPVLYLLIRVLGADQQRLQLIFQPNTFQILGSTLLLAVTVTAASVLIALPVAWLTTRTDMPFRRVFTVLTSLPMVIPSYIGAYLMVAFLGPRGMLAQGLANLGGMDIKLFPSIYGFPGAFLALTLLSYPYMLLAVRAALLGMDPALEETSRSLGSGPWKTFWRVTLPQLRPAVAAGGLLTVLYVLRDFGAVSIMRYDTFTRVIYLQYKSAFDRNTASGLALVLVLLTVVILIFEMWLRSRARYERSANSRLFKQSEVRLSGWRWPSLVFCFFLVAAALIIPVGVLSYWLLRGLEAGERLASLWPAVKNAFLAASLAAGCTVLTALPVAILSVRFPNRLSRLIHQISYGTFALPGIVIALALVYFGANYVFPLYQSLVMLVIAYIILFIPQAVGALHTSLLQVNPSLEEAARGLGRRPLAVIREITLPLIRPGLLSGAALVFLTTLKELPATLILSPIGFKTLAVAVWSAVSEAFFAQAAAPALLLILMASLPMALLISGEHQ